MKKKKQRRRNIGVQSFIVSVDVFDIEALIIVGAKTKEDIYKVFKKYKILPSIVKNWMNDDGLPWLLKQSAGTLQYEDNLAIIYTFKGWEDVWKNYEIIVHEVSHMVDYIAKHKNLEKETEARAYLSEYLFRSIRKGMQALTPNPSNT